MCVVVTRYFGGILLGTGGLVRAYTEGAKIAVDAAEILNMHTADKLVLRVEYPLYGRLAAPLTAAGAVVESEGFAENVEICLYIKEELTEKLTAELVDLCNGKIDVENVQKLEYDFGNSAQR